MRFIRLLIYSHRPSRFFHLWLYLAREEIRILKWLTVYSTLASVIHYFVLGVLTLFIGLREDRSILLAYIVNYSAKLGFAKFFVFKDKEKNFEKLFIQWLYFMGIARINTFIIRMFREGLEWGFVSTVVIMIPISTIVIYTVSRFLVFKKN